MNGWRLRDDLKATKSEPNHSKIISIVFEDDKPIGIALKDYSNFVQCFVRKSKRGKGLGKSLVQSLNIDNRSHAGYGIVGSLNFWRELGVRIE